MRRIRCSHSCGRKKEQLFTQKPESHTVFAAKAEDFARFRIKINSEILSFSLSVFKLNYNKLFLCASLEKFHISTPDFPSYESLFVRFKSSSIFITHIHPPPKRDSHGDSHTRNELKHPILSI